MAARGDESAACGGPTAKTIRRRRHPEARQVHRIRFRRAAGRQPEDRRQYSVVLDRIRKIAGEGEVPRRLRVVMVASHHGSIASEPLISVVLVLQDGKFTAVYWDPVMQSTCLPRELTEDVAAARDVYPSVVGDKRCFKFQE